MLMISSLFIGQVRGVRPPTLTSLARLLLIAAVVCRNASPSPCQALTKCRRPAYQGQEPSPISLPVAVGETARGTHSIREPSGTSPDPGTRFAPRPGRGGGHPVPPSPGRILIRLGRSGCLFCLVGLPHHRRHSAEARPISLPAKLLCPARAAHLAALLRGGARLPASRCGTDACGWPPGSVCSGPSGFRGSRSRATSGGRPNVREAAPA